MGDVCIPHRKKSDVGNTLNELLENQEIMTMTTTTQEIQKAEEQAVDSIENTRDREVFSPRADVFETGEAIVIVADMPGVVEDSVNITLEKSVLTLQGRVDAPEREGYKLIYGEYQDGDYERSFALSEGVDRDGIEATVKDGVLRLILLKSKEAAARKIPVKAG